MVIKVGASSGIYYAAREAELHNALRKVGYTLTRGTSSMEIALDVAHEVTFTEGKLIRQLAKKQGIQLNAHGDLAVPICIPERGEWRDAHDRMTKSLRSAVFLGAHYIDFHACLNIWLELITYAGRKLTMSFCDEEGKFISDILYKNRETREWFIKIKGDLYLSDILNRKERTELNTRITVREDKWFKETTLQRMTEALKPFFNIVLREERDPRTGEIRRLTVEGRLDEVVERTIVSGLPAKIGLDEVDAVIKEVHDKMREDRVIMNAKIQEEEIDQMLREKFSNRDPKERQWYSEELRAVVGIVDGYHIMSHYLYWTQDPNWVAMANEYKDVLNKYDYRTGDPDWLDEAWKKAERENDREYKEFFYAAVGAKYLEGHLKSAFDWLKNELIKKDIPRLTKDQEEREELIQIAKNLIIGIENPDAREPQHAGLYFLFRPKQIYAAIKTIRRTLNTNRVMMIVDHEQIATQGIDSTIESRRDILSKPDFGKLTISIHANHPNPLHAHAPIELGDVILYELLYNLRVTGFGVNQIGYMIFERGGGQDPFVHSIDALKLMAIYLQTEPPTKPDKLPLEFFGIKGLTAGDVQRQMQIIKDHAWEPMKDLLEIPEEEWTMLSQAAIKKGKKPEAWKRGEFR